MAVIRFSLIKNNPVKGVDAAFIRGKINQIDYRLPAYRPYTPAKVT
jgi:hypothetical protein